MKINIIFQNAKNQNLSLVSDLILKVDNWYYILEWNGVKAKVVYYCVMIMKIHDSELLLDFIGRIIDYQPSKHSLLPLLQPYLFVLRLMLC